MWWFFNILFSLVFLFSIVLSIPVAFDVGGRDTGLAYSLSLFLYYLVYSAIRLGTTSTTNPAGTALSALLRSSQWIVLPSLLIWALGQFAVDAGADSSSSWVKRSLEGVLHWNRDISWTEWMFGKQGVLETVSLGAWDSVLGYSGPVFQLLEGFCTLLVIQAAGRITRWLVNRGRSDTWVITLLAFSGSVISTAVYFLWRVAQFPQINNLDAVLIGVTMTTAVFLCAYGIGSGRGNPVESSLLFAYVVLCVYQIFTDYLPSDSEGQFFDQESSDHATPPALPPIIMASYSTLLHMIGSLPLAVHSSLVFLYAAFQTITPSVIISLAYRFFVFYCATRIIPSLRDLGARAWAEEPDWEDSGEPANKVLAFLSWFSPSILIAVYTSLLLQHFSTSDGPDGWTLRAGDVGGNPWRWINVGLTIALYGIELRLSTDEQDHWKVD